MSGYTLISSLGTGMYKEGYRKTPYKFSDDCVITSSLFLKAVLESKRWNVEKVILVGTRTSSWDVLIPEDGHGGYVDEELWVDLNECAQDPGSSKDECGKDQGISDAHIAKLEQKLPGWYGGLPFELKVHTPELDAATVPDVFEVYRSLSEDIARQESKILLDITHGFRSMPMLMYQALQFDDSRLSGDDVEIIYGEYIGEYISGEKVSRVRNLSGFWKLSKIAQAKRLFESKLNGQQIADEIRPHWEAGAKCLERLSEVVECNYSLQIPEVLKQINNAVKNFDDAAPHAPQWVVDVKNDLAKISKRLTVKVGEKYPVSKTVLEYARLLDEKSLTTQAAIALWVSVETAVTEHLAPSDPSKIGDYGWYHGYYDDTNQYTRGQGKEYFNQMLWKFFPNSPVPDWAAKLSADERKQYNEVAKKLTPLRNLENLRNNIAHGGSKDRNGNQPHQANIPRILKEAFGAMDALYLNLQWYKPNSSQSVKSSGG